MDITTSRKTFPFLDLPPEIRDQIYSHTFDKQLHKHEDHICCSFNLTALRVNRQISEEARRILNRDHTFVKIRTPWEEAGGWTQKYGKVPVLATGESAENWGPAKLVAKVIALTDPTPPNLFTLIILADDLYEFCLHWFYQELHFQAEAYPGMNCHFYLSLKIENIDNAEEEVPVPKQKQLLEHFGLIKNVPRIDFDGVHPDVKEWALEMMKSPANTPTECLESAMRWKEIGNEAITKKKYQQALDYYFDAFKAIHVVIHGRERDCYAEVYFQTQLDRKVDDSTSGNIVYFKLRVRLVANVMQAYVYLEKWEDVKYWGMRSIELIRDIAGPMADTPNENIPGSESWGKIYYRVGQACERLGEAQEAREMYRVAKVWLPNYRAAAEAVDRTALRIG